MTDKRRPHGTGSISQRKDGLWVARVDAGWTAQGTRRRVTVSSKSKSECQRKLKELQRKMAAGDVPAPKSARVTVKAWALTWLPRHAANVRPTTYTTDAGTIRKWIVPTLGHRRLADLTPGDLRALRDAITSEGRSTTTALHAHKILVKMLKDARIEGHSVPERIMDVPKPGKAANDRNAIPVDQALRILDVATKRPDATRWVSAIIQGNRQGETLGLTWDRVDLERDLTDVSWQLQWLGKDHTTPDGWEARHLTGRAWLTRPKTSASRRAIPLVPWMKAALFTERQTWRENPWGLVWTDEDGLPIRDDKDREAWREIQTAAKVAHPSGRPWHLHEMRHATATLLIEQGVDRSIVEAIMGHTVLVESYLHVGMDATRKALEGVAERLALGGDA